LKVRFVLIWLLAAALLPQPNVTPIASAITPDKPRRPRQIWLAELAAAPSLLAAVAATFIGIPAAAYLLASGSGPVGLAVVGVPIAVFVVAMVTPIAGAYAGSRIRR
jgi:hypothetical protein